MTIVVLFALLTPLARVCEPRLTFFGFFAFGLVMEMATAPSVLSGEGRGRAHPRPQEAVPTASGRSSTPAPRPRLCRRRPAPQERPNDPGLSVAPVVGAHDLLEQSDEPLALVGHRLNVLQAELAQD